RRIEKQRAPERKTAVRREACRGEGEQNDKCQRAAPGAGQNRPNHHRLRIADRRRESSACKRVTSVTIADAASPATGRRPPFGMAQTGATQRQLTRCDALSKAVTGASPPCQ